MSRPSYGPILAAYGVFAGASALLVRRRSRSPSEPKGSDVVLLGLATFKLSRVLARDKVTQPVREPFVEDTEAAEGGEVNSKPAGTGVRRAIGELLTCPFCVSVWVATALTTAFALAPRATRLAASGLAATALADASQYGFVSLRQAAD